MIPQRDGSVGPSGGESIVPAFCQLNLISPHNSYVLRMESDSVDWPNIVRAIDSLAVALERVLLGLGLTRGIKVFHRHAPFDRGHRKTYMK